MKGKVTILFSHEGIEIEIEDEVSGLRIVEATLDKDATLKALSRQACVEADLVCYHVQPPFGFKYEVKTETLDFTDVPRSADKYYHYSDMDAMGVAGVHEVNGWRVMRTGTGADWNNGHQRIPVGKASKDKTLYRVHYSRYVHPVTGDPFEGPKTGMAPDHTSSSAVEDILENTTHGD